MDNKKNFNPNADLSEKETLAHKVGDKIERLGKKVSDAGAPKIGNAIHKAGDKIEHSRDKK